MTPADALLEAGRRGRTLRPSGDKLLVIPARLCAPDFAETLRRHKPALMALLRMRFLIVQSALLNETVFLPPTTAPARR